MNPQIISETPRWLVLSKPAGWLSIPGRKSPGALAPAPCLLDWVQHNVQGPVFVVHRLDVETSGVILFARTAEDHRTANLWFQKHQAKKIYYCLAQGVPTAPVLRMNTPIEGAPSITQVEVVERFSAAFLAKIRLVSGRRHQIRIHLSQQGYPLWGDVRYGGSRTVKMNSTSDETWTIPRVALHAASLELPTGERFEAPWPEDFQGWVESLRKKG